MYARNRQDMLFGDFVQAGTVNIQDLVRDLDSNPLPWDYASSRMLLTDGMALIQAAENQGQGLPGQSKRDTALSKLQFHDNVLNNVDADQTDAPYMGSWDLSQWIKQAAIEYNSVLAGVDSLGFISTLRQDIRAITSAPRRFIQSNVAEAAQTLAQKVQEALAAGKQDVIDAANEASNNFIAANAAHPFQVQISGTTTVLVVGGVVALGAISYLVYRLVSRG